MRDKAVEQLTSKIVDELATARKAQGISHETLAEMTGMSRAGISFVESHKNTPTLTTCLKIAKALKVRLGDILNKFEK